MLIHYVISGTYTVPAGSAYVTGSVNLVRLPDGRVVSVHPIVEMASEANSDDHVNLSYEEARTAGIMLNDYERTSFPD